MSNAGTGTSAAPTSPPTPRRAGAVTVLDGPGIVDWAALAIERLSLYREQINALNVFPVPDSDTGTNMLHTMRAGLDYARRDDTRESGAGAREIAVALGQGAVRGARGNSGIILSQVLRALGESASFSGLDAQTFKRTLRTAVILVEHSVSDPVEGTIITVLREASAAAQRCTAGDLPSVARAAADAAAEALARTPQLLPALGSAGVVDAGGRGLLVLLDSLVEILDGDSPQRPDYSPPAGERDAGALAEGRGAPTQADTDRAPAPRFEVMYSLNLSTQEKADTLRDELAAVGDSVVVVGDGSPGDLARWSVHVHCDDIGASIEMGLAAGAVSEIRVTELCDDVAAQPELTGRVVVAFTEKGPLAELFAEAGAVTLPPATGPHGVVEQLLAAAARELIVLPNGALTREQIAEVDTELRAHGRHVIIVPTQSVVQGLAALAVHDEHTTLSLDGFAMADAASATRFARLDVARDRALTLVGKCEVGDVLGIIGHDVAVIATEPKAALLAVVDRLTATGGELLTVVASPQLPEAAVADVVAELGVRYPDLEIVTYQTGNGRALAHIGLE